MLTHRLARFTRPGGLWRCADLVRDGDSTTARTKVQRLGTGVIVGGLILTLAACTSGGAGSSASSPSASGPSVYKPSTSQSPAQSATVSVAPAPKTTVSPPSSGSIFSTVATHAASERAAVPLASTGHFGGHVSVRVTKLQAESVKAERPGEVSGPGLALTVTISNGSRKPIDLGDVIVDLSDSSGAPADPMSAKPARAFAGSLAAGRTATGVYVFTIDKQHRKPITVKVSYTSAAPVVVFAGDAS